MIICTYRDYFTLGKTAQEAWDEMRGLDAEVFFDDCTFYNAPKIEVQMKVELVEQHNVVETHSSKGRLPK